MQKTLTTLIMMSLVLGCTPSTSDPDNESSGGGSAETTTSEQDNPSADGATTEAAAASDSPADEGNTASSESDSTIRLACNVTVEGEADGTQIMASFCIVATCTPTPSDDCDADAKPACSDLDGTEDGLTITSEPTEMCSGTVVASAEAPEGEAGSVECFADEGSVGAIICAEVAEGLINGDDEGDSGEDDDGEGNDDDDDDSDSDDEGDDGEGDDESDEQTDSDP